MHITRSVEQTIKRVGLYARVSTKNHGQTPETQLVALREYVANRKFEIVHEYVDTGFSGAKDRRRQLDRLMRDAKLKKFDAVVVARFDRFARSTRHLILALEEFHSLGIDFISLNESVDTSTPMGKMVFTVIGAVAELERSLIKERVMKATLGPIFGYIAERFKPDSIYGKPQPEGRPSRQSCAQTFSTQGHPERSEGHRRFSCESPKQTFTYWIRRCQCRDKPGWLVLRWSFTTRRADATV